MGSSPLLRFSAAGELPSRCEMGPRLSPVLWVGREDMEFRPESERVPERFSALCTTSGLVFSLGARMRSKLLWPVSVELVFPGTTGVNARTSGCSVDVLSVSVLYSSFGGVSSSVFESLSSMADPLCCVDRGLWLTLI